MQRARSEEKGEQVLENCLDGMDNLLGWDFLRSLGNIIPGFLFGFLGVLITEKKALNKTFALLFYSYYNSTSTHVPCRKL
jgi:hypothetical protein